MTARGVFPILPTPFDSNGVIDEASLRRLVSFEREVGVHGLAILGYMGEADKLSDTERRKVIEVVVDAADGSIPTWVGVRALGTAGAIEQARAAQQLGAEAVFVAPIGIQNDSVLFDFYSAIAEAIDVPIVIHDFPSSFGTILSPELIARMARDIGGVQYIKLEEPPVLVKMSRVLALAPDKIGVFGGLGGEYFIEELQRGARGIMTGFAFPEVLVAIYEAFLSGDERRAAHIFDRYVPLIRYEFQPKIGLALRKYVYTRRGILDSRFIRKPATEIDAETERELEAVVRRVGLSLDLPGIQDVTG